MTLRNHISGFTLVEALVTGALMGISAVAIITIMMVHNKELNEGIAKSRLQMVAETYAEQIGRDVRAGSHVLLIGESWDSDAADGTYTETTTGEFRIVNAAGTEIKAYRINNGVLQESTAPGVYVDFSSGVSEVSVTTATPFVISPSRQTVSARLALSISYKGKEYQIPPRGDSFRCRN